MIFPLPCHNNMNVESDPFNLSRFVEAPAPIFPVCYCPRYTAAGSTATGFGSFFLSSQDWGTAPYSEFYAIRNLEKNKQCLPHPLLGTRLLECTETVLQLHGRHAREIFTPPDDLKLRSCMTLFNEVAGFRAAALARLLDQYFQTPGNIPKHWPC